MQIRNIVWLLATILVLSACGGGSGTGSSDGGAGGNGDPGTDNPSGGDNNPPPDNDPPADDPPPDDPPPDNPGDDPADTPADQTQDLVIDADFDIQSSWEMAIDFDIPTSGEAYLSVCKEFTTTPTGYEINFDSCLVRAPVTNGVYDGSVVVTNEVTRVIGALYFFNEVTQPLYREFRLINGQAEISWN
ncbi:MAG: hypothetical protein AAF529_24250 [Pseudomonadota bacterium]